MEAATGLTFYEDILSKGIDQGLAEALIIAISAHKNPGATAGQGSPIPEGRNR